MNLDELKPETLTDESAQEVVDCLTAKARERHARIAMERRGVVLRGFCVCGHSSRGVGGDLCGRLRDLAEGGDEAEWLTKARALRDALEGR